MQHVDAHRELPPPFAEGKGEGWGGVLLPWPLAHEMSV